MTDTDNDTNGIMERLQSVLEGNGNIPPVMREKLILEMLGAIYQLDRDVNRRVKVLEEYLPWLKGSKWIVYVLAASVIALLWSIYTGRVDLIYH